MLQQMIKIFDQYGYVYAKGLWGTIWLSLVTVIAATLLGTLVALMKMSRFKLLNILVNIYIEVIRGTPILLQLYFFWLFLPKALPFEMTDTQCIVVALIVNSCAYVAEVIRSGIQAVDHGQMEAALSLGLSKHNTMTRVILPQAVKNILPALGNEFIVMIKETSMASVFFVSELTTSYKTVQSATFLAIPSLTISGMIYLALTFTLTRLLGVLERKLRSNDR